MSDSYCMVFVGLSVFPHNTNLADSVHTGYILRIQEGKVKVRTIVYLFSRPEAQPNGFYQEYYSTLQ